jgi:tetratricopeptide (TPR) repeat protein
MIRRVSGWALALLLLGAGCAGTGALPAGSAANVDPASAARELVGKANAAAAAGDMTRAEQYLVAALRSGGNEQRVMKRLLWVCVAAQRYAVASAYAEQYLYRHPKDALIAHAAATLHLALGERTRAQTLLEAVVGARPEWAEPHFALASLLRDGGASAAADAHDLAYLKLAPHGPMAEVAQTRLGRAN